MENELKLPDKIHIAVLGYEIDRIVEPLKRMGASKFYLIIGEEDSPVAKQFIPVLKKKIVIGSDESMESLEVDGKNVTSDNLIPLDSFKEEPVKSVWNYTQLLNKFCDLIKCETEKGNKVYINISSGSKLAAVAGSIAAYMYGGEPYYVQVKDYNYINSLLEKGESINGLTTGVSQIHSIPNPETSGVKNILSVPNYSEIKKPDENLIKALSMVPSQSPGISQKDFMKILIDKGLIAGENENAVYIGFRRKYLEPLLDKKWIRDERRDKKSKESELILTDSGTNVIATFSSIFRSRKEGIC